MQKRKLHFSFLLLLLLLFLFPLQTLAYSSEIIPGGENIGIQLKSNGVMIVGFYKVDNVYLGSEAGLELGDRIIRVDDTEVTSISELVEAIDQGSMDSKVHLTFIRDGKTMETDLSLILDQNQVYKTGLFVKDQINGIGTLTYIDPNSFIYGALGHEIADQNSSVRIEVKEGKIVKSEVTGIEKSENGSPGEKRATNYQDQILGNIKENTSAGIFGTYGGDIPKEDAIPVANPDDVKLGDATIRTVLEGETVEEFTIRITHIDPNSETKNILFEITDQELLDKTGGVIQGMSGSPILQDGKIIGAVTHVIVNSANKGYGIFITTMLEEGEN